MSMVSEAIADMHGDEIDALNDRNQYLEQKLQEAYKRIHQLENELDDSRWYAREQADRQEAEEEFQRNIHGYEGQP
jgi:predicted  nucleic acid-binding Zn-ribbon protein